MSDDLIGAMLRALAYIAFGLAVIVLAQMWGRKRYNRRIKELKSTTHARRG